MGSFGGLSCKPSRGWGTASVPHNVAPPMHFYFKILRISWGHGSLVFTWKWPWHYGQNLSYPARESPSRRLIQKLKKKCVDSSVRFCSSIITQAYKWFVPCRLAPGMVSFLRTGGPKLKETEQYPPSFWAKYGTSTYFWKGRAYFKNMWA